MYGHNPTVRRNQYLVLAALIGGMLLIALSAFAFLSPKLSVLREAHIEEVHDGFWVQCHQHGNPYLYYKGAADTRTEAAYKAALCFDTSAGQPDDRRRR
jgi:hypothetical protein